MSKILQLKYDELNAIVKTFNGEGEDFAQLVTTTRQRLQDLRKDWIGESADKFFAEMEQDLLPALTRVSKAHFFSQDVLMKVTKIIRETDEENANFFKNIFQGSDDFGASGFESVLDGLGIGGGGGGLGGDFGASEFESVVEGLDGSGGGGGGLGGDFGASEFESVAEGLDGSGGESGDFGPPPAADLSAITRDFTQGIDLESTKGDEETPAAETPSSGGGGGGGGAGSSQGLQGDLKNMGVGLVDQTPQTSSVSSGAPQDLPDHLFGGAGSGSGAPQPPAAPGGGSASGAEPASESGSAAAAGIAGAVGSAAVGAAVKAVKDAKKDDN
jgi:WXG100 family type VII secretion target